jgi:hypothetical protein
MANRNVACTARLAANRWASGKVGESSDREERRATKLAERDHLASAHQPFSVMCAILPLARTLVIGLRSRQAACHRLLQQKSPSGEGLAVESFTVVSSGRAWVRTEMDLSYNLKVIAGVIALAIALAIAVRIARGIRRRLRAFSRTMTFLS